MVRKSGYSDPKCWWCGKNLPLDCEWRGNAPELGLPMEVGVYVCGPNCKKQPDNSFVYTHDSLLRG